MSFQPDLDFESARLAAEDGEAFVVDLDGYEGPLHVLLALARSQKVDLLKLSITKLCDQYLTFVREASKRQFSLAADYLVMAAWLAYLKSRLLLPKPEHPDAEELPAEEIAAQLAFRGAAETLRTRPILKRDVFARGDPQAITVIPSRHLEGDLYELMAAYVGQRRKEEARHYRPAPQQSYPLDDARERLRGLLAELERWTPLTGVAPMERGPGPTRASYLASTLSATLELVREGDLEARQLEAFAEVYLRARKAAA